MECLGSSTFYLRRRHKKKKKKKITYVAVIGHCDERHCGILSAINIMGAKVASNEKI